MKKIFNIGALLVVFLGFFSVKAQVEDFKNEVAGMEITAMKKSNSLDDISVYPNPSVSQFTVSTQEDLTVKVYDHLGDVVEQFKTNASQKTFGEDLLPGVYHLNFLQKDQVVKRLNVVKNW